MNRALEVCIKFAVCFAVLSTTSAQAGDVLFIGDLDGDESGDGSNPLFAAADTDMIQHITNMPQVSTVTAVDDNATGIVPTDFDAVIISATVFSGNVLSSYGGDGSTLFNAAVPILSMEPGLADDVPLNDSANTQGQDTTFSITVEESVLSGKPVGSLDIFVAESEVILHATLDDFVAGQINIPASLAPGATAVASYFSPIFGIRFAPIAAVLEGDLLADESAAPAARVGTFVGLGSFGALTADGLMLFDRTVRLVLPLPGDMDSDGDVDFDDISPFVLGLNDPDSYESDFGVPPASRGDLDEDGDQDFDDIGAFVDAIIGGENQHVPEPSTLLLALFGLVGAAWVGWRRVA